jgi:hypothetical protein
MSWPPRRLSTRSFGSHRAPGRRAADSCGDAEGDGVPEDDLDGVDEADADTEAGADADADAVTVTVGVATDGSATANVSASGFFSSAAFRGFPDALVHAHAMTAATTRTPVRTDTRRRQ